MRKDFELPESLFWAGSAEATAENYLKHRENALLGELVHRLQRCRVPAAAEHLRGCSRRLMMMQFARVEILATAREEAKPLATDKLNLQNVCLNSYYLNLLGALDNLAWAATHEFALLPVVDENVFKTRVFCTLSNKKFLTALRQHASDLAQLVEAQAPWMADLKRLRDPAAHRLPLAIARGVMSEEEGRRYEELSKASVDALLEDRWEESDRLQAEADGLGRYVPLLDGPRAANNGIYIVPNQMAVDQRTFLQFTFTFLSFLPEATT